MLSKFPGEFPNDLQLAVGEVLLELLLAHLEEFETGAKSMKVHRGLVGVGEPTHHLQTLKDVFASGGDKI